jgi:hypothetical protein
MGRLRCAASEATARRTTTPSTRHRMWMRQTLLDSTTKEALRKMVRGLRQPLIDAFLEHAKSEYHLDVPADKARLTEAAAAHRRRLEQWIEEQCRATRVKKAGSKAKGAKDPLRMRFLEQAAKEAAYTLLNRLVFVRTLEHHGLVAPPLVSGGWKSAAYADEFVPSAEALLGDPTRGYQALLEMLFAELALELPGLFGPVGLTQLFLVPAATLRAVIEALNEPALDAAWGDDTTLGWVYQFWNDPEREALDAKIADGGKIEPHELAAKTQMYTERYMVEWLLHNSLGQTWLAICEKHEWTPDFEQVRQSLEQRRAEWRRRREAGEVALDALMPIRGPLEEAWKYWVQQPLLPEAVAAAPESIRDLKLLDPACGSGHFLVVAFDLLAALYEEEARHRGARWEPQRIAADIVERNLHGIDIDARAVQLAAASLWLKARLYASGAERRASVRSMNLVAPSFRFAGLPQGDVALECLCKELLEIGVPRDVTLRLVKDLQEVEHFGTLLRVEGELHALLAHVEERLGQLQTNGVGSRQAAIQAGISEFLESHAARADLGLRLDGEQVASGLRFVDLVADGTYDIVVGNPPYQGTSKLWDSAWFKKHYPTAQADLFACFLQRGLQLAKPGGMSALLTMRAWMFLSKYQELRQCLVRDFDLRAIGDFDRGAFDDVPNEVLAVVGSIFSRRAATGHVSVAVLPTPANDASYDRERTNRKRAAVLTQIGRYDFLPSTLRGIEGAPLVYWWDEALLKAYVRAPKLGATAQVSTGCQTSRDPQFLRLAWEVPLSTIRTQDSSEPGECKWSPITAGADGRQWIEPLWDVIKWSSNGLELRAFGRSYPRNLESYFLGGVAFSDTGNRFSARLHRHPSVIGDKGPTVVIAPAMQSSVLCMMNRTDAKETLLSLNPGVDFQVGDVKRLAIIEVLDSDRICALLKDAFNEHESHREPSVEFVSPGPSRWRYAQSWAQQAVDRAKGVPLPHFETDNDPPQAKAYISFSIGISLGRFGANGEGIRADSPKSSLPAGILYISPSDNLADSLNHPAAAPIHAAWAEHSPAILDGKRQDLRDWLRKDFFAYHKPLYENRPIYFPLSSRERNFVAFVSIHRWADNTLQVLLSSHLKKNLSQLDGEITDLNRARSASNKQASSTAEKQYARTKKLRDELAEFIDKVSQCAHRGAPPTDPQCTARAVDAPFHMDLDDGVMINSAALWPLLESQWKDPKKWWKELCTPQGRKDYDWAHLAQRYFPDRVDDKCKTDPSLGVAHGCFWKYHPAKAYAWELRLQHEIGKDFTIEEPDAAKHRRRFLSEQRDEAERLRQKELVRRQRAEQKQSAEDDDSSVSPENDVDPAEAEAENDVESGPTVTKARNKRAPAAKKRAAAR